MVKRLVRLTPSLISLLAVFQLCGGAFVSLKGQSPSLAPVVTAQGNEEGRLLFTLLDQDSELPELSIENLRLSFNKKPQRLIALRKSDAQQLALAILIDTSLSQERSLPNQKRAADDFVRTIMQPTDQAAVLTFTEKMTIEQPLTNDTGLARRAIAQAKITPPPGYVGRGIVIKGSPPPGQSVVGSTAIWDAVWQTSEYLSTAAAPEARRVIILLTDGADTSSERKLSESVKHATATSAAVYSIGIGDRYAYGIDEGALRKVSEKTGGHAFFPKKGQDLTNMFDEIRRELRYRYELTYKSTSSFSNSDPNVLLELIHPVLRPKELKISYQLIKARPTQ
jgi:Ca-activated chloride channel family protein